MKVIEPLFLNDLYEELDKHQDSEKKLLELQERIGKVKIFDPACGSGNFLIIAYKELRKLEMEILKRLQELEFEKSGQMFKPFSVIQLSQFYGIEIDDFAHEVAILSLWLTEHQMNVAFKDEFGESLPSLPLKNGGNIVSDNATRLNWTAICPINNESENYILGNPPYKGFSQQSKEQKADLHWLLGAKTKLDYISIWFIKASEYIQCSVNAQAGLVSTNSITQGEQVALLWPKVLNGDVEIGFAHTSFKWSNSAKRNAGVTCVIVGLRNHKRIKPKKIYSEGIVKTVELINGYLTDKNSITVVKRTKPLSSFPSMVLGNMPYDKGILHFSTEEMNQMVEKYPESSKFFRKILGSKEYIRGEERWCLWIHDNNLTEALSFDFIAKRLEENQVEREGSKDSGVRKLASKPHQFREMRESKENSLIIPGTSSEKRQYIPVGFLGSKTLINNLAFAIYDPEPFVMSIISSRMHMLWIRAVGGSLETRIRYSSVLCYNTFPFPKISEQKKAELSQSVFKILSERESYPNRSPAQLYDSTKMPVSLKHAHDENDLLIESCYRKKPFESDEERLEHLFNLYEKMIEEEKNA